MLGLQSFLSCSISALAKRFLLLIKQLGALDASVALRALTLVQTG